MATPVDDSRIVTSFLPSLYHLALVKVAVPLFTNFDTEMLEEAFTDIQQSNSATTLDYGKRNIGEIYSRATKYLLSIPVLLRVSVLKAVYGLEYAACHWLSSHSKYIILKEVKCVIHWRFDGTVDGSKTAHALVLNENIFMDVRFKLACIYCLEKNIWTLWHEMKATGYEIQFFTHYMDRFWYVRMDKGDPEVHWTQSVVEYLGSQFRSNPVNRFFQFYKPLIPSKSFEKFLTTLECTKQNYASVVLNSLVDRSAAASSFSSLFALLQSEDKQKLFNSLRNAEFSDLRSCMSALTEEEQKQILKANKNEITRKLLCSCLIWPMQNVFLETAEKLWENIELDTFRPFLIILLEFKKNRKDFDYSKLLEGFWFGAPSLLREFVKRDEDLWMRIHLCLKEISQK